MAIICVCGIKRVLEEETEKRIRLALSETDKNVIVLVPSQITLQTEMRLLSGTQGSFRLHVLSPSRLYTRIFQEAGAPAGVRIDKQGKTMLMRGAIHAVRKNLTRYQSSSDTSGFADRAVSQIEQLKQAHISPSDLILYAQDTPSAARREKLADIASLYTEYEKRTQGRFLDGEDETRAACERMKDSAFVRNAIVFACGFDTVSNMLTDTLFALQSASQSDVTLFLTGDMNLSAPDAGVYIPVSESLARLTKTAGEAGIPLSTELLPVPAPQDELRTLERMMFAYPMRPWQYPPRKVQAATLKNAQEECEFAAGLARHLVMKRGWRYRDILIACPNLDTEYADLLERAFRAHDVPLFLARSFTADRHPFARYFLSLVRMVFTGITTQDMLLYMGSGFSPLNGNDKDKMTCYAAAHDMRPNDWTHPLRYGEDAEEIEPLRASLAQDILALSEAVREQETTVQRLRLLFEHLESRGIYQKLVETQDADIAAGHRAWAAQTAQVYNRVLSCMDQMASLVGEDVLPLAMLPDLFEQSLATQEIRELPQSPDAVSAGDLGHMKGESVRALFLLGQYDAQTEASFRLLDEHETNELSDYFGRYIGMSERERSVLRRFSLKEMLSLPEEYLFVSCPMSGQDGKATRESPFFLGVRAIFPELKQVDNVIMRDSMRKLRINAKDAARIRLPALLREEAEDLCTGAREARGSGRKALYALSKTGETEFMRQAASTVLPESIRLSAPLVKKAYRDLHRVSITQLESFAPCPHRHFLQYALRPEIPRPYDLDRRAAGMLLHGAVERFVLENAQTLPDMTQEQSVETMRALADTLLSEEKARGKLRGGSGILTERYIRRTLDFAAETLSRYLSRSCFKPAALECEIEPGTLRIDPQTDIKGRIDRIDLYLSDRGRYVCVIDYKSGNADFSLEDVYNGQKLQLNAYLQSAEHMLGAKGAGMFYYAVRDELPEVKPDKIDTIENERRNELKMSGLMLSDEELFSALTGGEKQMLKISVNKGGGFSKNSTVLTPLQKDALDRRVMGFMREYMQSIREGDISMRPVTNGSSTACDSCPERSCCPFDNTLPGAFRLLRTLPKHEKGAIPPLLDAEP